MNSQDTLRLQQMARGTQGSPVALLSNFFLLKVGGGIIVHQYDIVIKKVHPEGAINQPAAESAQAATSGMETFIRKMTPAILKQLADSKHSVFAKVPYVHDGSRILYAAKPLNMITEPIVVTLESEGRRNTFSVQFNKVAEIKLDEAVRYYERKADTISPTVLTVCSMVLRFATEKYYAVHQHNFYDLTRRSSSPKVPLFDFAPGHVQSVRMTENGLALNIHLRTACLIAAKFSTLDKFVQEAASRRNERVNLESAALREGQLKQVSKILRGLRIQTTYSSQSYTVDSIIPQTPYQFQFAERNDEEKITVAQYFKRQYNIDQLKHYPMVKTTTSVRGAANKVVLPLELCKLVADQFVNDSKLDSLVSAEMLKLSKNDPKDYFRKVGNIVETVAQIDAELLAGFGFKLMTQPLKLTGRVLQPPKMLNGGRSIQEAAKSPVNWGILGFDGSITKVQIDQFIADLKKEARVFNLNFDKPRMLKNQAFKSYQDIDSSIQQLKKSNLEFVYVVVPQEHPELNSNDIYAVVKTFCDEYGIKSQCIDGVKLKNLPSGYFTNFLSKVNGKLGGLNMLPDKKYIQAVPLNMAETMVVGIDICHSSAGGRVALSVAAAVASLDDTMSHYTESIVVQRKERDEMVTQADSMIGEMLAQFRKTNKKYPRNVIIMRDGVSEGQFQLVKEVEMKSIREAVKKVRKDARLTLIVVQKRHHTRFVRTEADTSNPRKPTFNISKGTVVDMVVVNPTQKEFYLNSHNSPLGTAKPTKYTILEDDLNLNANQVQLFSNYACYNCIRSKNVISIPTAIKYADLLAFRGKLHLEANQLVGKCNPKKEQLEEAALIEQLNKALKIDDTVKNTLYYC